MQAETFTGLWWLPETPDTRFSGTLTIEANGDAKLRIVGTLSPLEQMNEVLRYPIVQGFSDTGKSITLVEASSAGFTFHAPGMPNQEIHPVLTLIGAHFASKEDIVASTVFADFTYLAEWVGPGVVRDSWDEDHFTITYAKPAFPVAEVGAQTLTLSPGYRVTGDGIRDRAIHPTYSLRVDGEADLEWLVRARIRPFQNFLTLGVYHPNVISRVAFKSSRGVQQREGAPISAVFVVDDPPSVSRTPTVHDMLFSLPHIEAEFPSLVPGWFAAHESLEDVCNLYFTTLQTGGPLEVQFLNLVRAVEVYDRIREGNAVLPRADHRARLRTIYLSVPKESLGWLKERLAYSNEPSLRFRMGRLLRQVPDVMVPIVGDLPAFAKLVADTRNYYTHYDPASAAKAATGIGLYRTCQRLQVMIGALLLHAANMDAGALNGLFQSNQAYIFLRRVHLGHEDG